MFEFISTRFQAKTVSVQLESFNPTKFQRLFPNNTQNVPFSVNVNLYKFTYQMGLASHEGRITDSRLTKFYEHVGLTRRITNDPHLNFEIVDMNPEDKGRASKTIGEALSRCLIISLFNVQENTIEPIERSGERPDFSCDSSRQERIICESKGSFNSVSQQRIDKALTQKRSERGDIQIAAINNIGRLTRLIDPPIDYFERDRFKQLISKTNHYIQIFKLAGQKDLTKYFKLMKLRFRNKNMTDFPQFSEKTKLWFKLKYEQQRRTIDDYSFIGKVELIDNGKIMFIGFDERLLNVDSFERFVDYPEDYIDEENDITTYRSRDGVCFVEAPRTELINLFPELRLADLKYYREATLLSDVDSMNEQIFSNYLNYIFEKSNIEVSKEMRLGKYIVDFVVVHKKIKFYIELKLFGRDQQLVYSKKIKNLLEDRFHILTLDSKPKKEINFLPEIDLKKQILITNIDKRLIPLPKDVHVFDRNDLKKLMKNPDYFIEFLSKLSITK